MELNTQKHRFKWEIKDASLKIVFIEKKKKMYFLKESNLNLVVEELTFMLKTTDNLSAQDFIKRALSYFDSHKNRMDYKSYLNAGLVIGSGVIESSNKLVVTKRLKQGGMHWSISGAEF